MVTTSRYQDVFKHMSHPAEPPSDLFVRVLRVPRSIADALVAHEFTSLEQLAYTPVEELLELPDLEAWLLRELREHARLPIW